MGGFRARNIRFCSVSDIGVAEERLIWYFKLRHFVYLAIAALFFASSSGSTIRMIFAIFLATIALTAALYPRKAISFEALFLGALYFPFARKKEVLKLETKIIPIEANQGNESSKVRVKLKSDEFLSADSETVAGDYTRRMIETKKMKIKKI